MSKRKNINEKIVTSKEALINAIEADVVKIVVKGDYAQQIFKEFRKRKLIRGTGKVVAALFTLLSLGAGAPVIAVIFGGVTAVSAATSRKLERYDFKFVSEDEIILIMKDKYASKFVDYHISEYLDEDECFDEDLEEEIDENMEEDFEEEDEEIEEEEEEEEEIKPKRKPTVKKTTPTKATRKPATKSRPKKK